MAVKRLPRTPPTALVKVEDHALPATTPEERSFDPFYQDLYPRLVRFAQRLVDYDPAKDAVQDTMISIWQRWPSLVMENPPPAYYFGAVRNRIAAMRLRERREAVRVGEYLYERFGDGPATASRADAGLEGAEVNAVFEAAIAAMPPACRACWALVRENDIPYKHAAEVLGVSVSAVKQAMTRAYAIVRAALVDAGYTKEEVAGLLSPRSTKLLPLPQTSAAEGEVHE